MDTIPIDYPNSLPDYSLLDSGNREKLEQFGSYTIIRPDPRAFWAPNNPDAWENADAKFIRTDAEHGEWKVKRQPPSPWYFSFEKLRFLLHPTDFKHVGIFPEQAVNWTFIQKELDSRLPRRVKAGLCGNDGQVRVLNLFGYTGAATVVSANAGSIVTHLDSSKPSITWANENYQLNNLPKDHVRWIEDDAYKFVIREKTRRNVYDAIIMDPPRFGRGSKGEVWKLTDDLPTLLRATKEILSPSPVFLIVNAYTADVSSIAIDNLIKSIFSDMFSDITTSELTLKESTTNRLLPNGIVCRGKNLNTPHTTS